MARRPPKPEGVTSAPRTLTKERSVKQALEACRALINSDMTRIDTLNYLLDTSVTGNDRAQAIIYAANLENSLDYAVSEIFVADRVSFLFRLSGPLGTFSNKIDIAYAFNIIDKETKLLFDIIRTIRNVFAHARRPINFQTKEVSDLCGYIVEPKLCLLHLSHSQS